MPFLLLVGQKCHIDISGVSKNHFRAVVNDNIVSALTENRSSNNIFVIFQWFKHCFCIKMYWTEINPFLAKTNAVRVCFIKSSKTQKVPSECCIRRITYSLTNSIKEISILKICALGWKLYLEFGIPSALNKVPALKLYNAKQYTSL